MSQYVDAIYRSGVFLPKDASALTLSEGQEVRLSVEPAALQSGPDLLTLCASVYEGLSDNEVDQVEQIATDRSQFFSN